MINRADAAESNQEKRDKNSKNFCSCRLAVIDSIVCDGVGMCAVKMMLESHEWGISKSYTFEHGIPTLGKTRPTAATLQ